MKPDQNAVQNADQNADQMSVETKLKLRQQLRLYLVIGLDQHGGRTALEIVKAAIDGGVTMVQLRQKEGALRQWLPAARQLRELCRAANVPFLVNDRVDVAILLDTDGVHVGQDDLPGLEARKLLGSGKIIGISAGTEAEMQWALSQGADYLGIGPIYATATKSDAGQAIGTALIRAAAAHSIPSVAIGGIDATNAASVFQAGAAGIAVVSAIASSQHPGQSAAALRSIADDFAV